jgi:hypothetical protein
MANGKYENVPVDPLPDDAVCTFAQSPTNLVLLPDVGVDIVRDWIGHLHTQEKKK